MSVNCWKVVVEKQKFGEMNHTKNMIVVDNLFITCCFLIVAFTKCKSLSLVLLFYVVSVIPILYCSYWPCMFVSDTMHSTYTGLFSHANGPNLIKQHFYLTTDSIAHFDTFSLLKRCSSQTHLNRQQQKYRLFPLLPDLGMCLVVVRSISFSFAVSKTKRNSAVPYGLLAHRCPGSATDQVSMALITYFGGWKMDLFFAFSLY